jgi:hypothetical protein
MVRLAAVIGSWRFSHTSYCPSFSVNNAAITRAAPAAAAAAAAAEAVAAAASA